MGHIIAKPSLAKFFCVAVVSNPIRYKRRYHLYKRFEEMCDHAGVQLITVELGFGTRDFEITRADHHMHLQIRSHDEFWHKENMINLGIAHGRKLFPNADKVMWSDADTRPARPPREWFEETWHALEHYKFVQCWEALQPLDINQMPLCAPNPSFMSNYVKFGTPYPKRSQGYPQSWGSPGLAWAANISDLDLIGGIPDVAILGAGDWYLAHMLISDLAIKDMDKYSPGYRGYWEHKQELCNRHIRGDVGYVPGLMYHEFHGAIKHRGYDTREQILIEGKYDPNTDLKRDHQGLYQIETWEPRQRRMYDRIRAYFRRRNEDSIDP